MINYTLYIIIKITIINYLITESTITQNIKLIKINLKYEKKFLNLLHFVYRTITGIIIQV